jgi:hypothetical protein
MVKTVSSHSSAKTDTANTGGKFRSFHAPFGGAERRERPGQRSLVNYGTDFEAGTIVHFGALHLSVSRAGPIWRDG